MPKTTTKLVACIIECEGENTPFLIVSDTIDNAFGSFREEFADKVVRSVQTIPHTVGLDSQIITVKEEEQDEGGMP